MSQTQAPSKPQNSRKAVKTAQDTKKSKSAAKQAEIKPKAVAKLGRPSTYNTDIAAELCSRIAEGKSLRKVCEDEDMPSIRAVYNWLESHPEFVQHYTRAKEDSADAYADDIQDIADKVLSGEIPAKAGHVAIQAKMWSASKLKPKRYGERLDVTSGGEAIQPPNIYLPSELPYNAVTQVDSSVIEHEAIEG